MPGRIIKKWQANRSNIPMALVDFGGIQREICLTFTPDVRVDEYVMAHVGFAISIIDEQIAKETLKIYRKNEVLAKKGSSEKP